MEHILNRIQDALASRRKQVAKASEAKPLVDKKGLEAISHVVFDNTTTKAEAEHRMRLIIEALEGCD